MNFLLWTLAAAGLAAGPDDELKELEARRRPRIERAVAYLKKGRRKNGSFGDGEFQTPVTALVIAALVQAKAAPPSDPLVAQGLSFLQSKVEPDGSVKAGREQSNYTTAVCLSAFVAADKDRRHKSIVAQAVERLKKEQWDEGEGIDEKDVRYGGVGYGGKSRPDLSATTFVLEALHAAGLPADDPAFQHAEIFLGRCQCVSRDGGDARPAGEESNDGGFFYTPAGRRDERASAWSRSYGSMTSSGLRSLLYAGVQPDDPRVQAARKWIGKHYTFKENPGRGSAGLYYYYHSFAKALAALEVDEVVDDKKQTHRWRSDLIRALLLRQRPDGSWFNDDRHWMENDPRLATAYALSALGQAMDGLDEK